MKTPFALLGALCLVVSACGPASNGAPDAGAPLMALTGGSSGATGGGSVAGGGTGGGSMVGGGTASGGGSAVTGGGTASGGGAASGGGTASGGGSPAGGGSFFPGCPPQSQCTDATGAGDFECLDPSAPDYVPAGSQVCHQNAPCAQGYDCFRVSAGATTGYCLQNCIGSGSGGGSGSTGGGSASNGGGTGSVRGPAFVASGPAAFVSADTSLTLSLPGSLQSGDFLIALVDAVEETRRATLTPPAGWTALNGFPIHNVNTAHAPYVIPASENQGVWVYYRFTGTNEPASEVFTFGQQTTARAMMIAYRGVDTSNPIHDQVAMPFNGTGGTNGFGLIMTSLSYALEVNLMATAQTQVGTYLLVDTNLRSITERANTGHQANGLNLAVHDGIINMGYAFGPSFKNRQDPSSSSAALMFTFVTLVLTPR